MQNDTLGLGSSLVTAHVLDPEGGYLGSIEELLIDWGDGRIRYIVVRLDGAHRRRAVRLVLPWGVLRLDRGARAFISKVGEETLERVAQRVDGAPPDSRGEG